MENRRMERLRNLDEPGATTDIGGHVNREHLPGRPETGKENNK